MFSIYEEQDLVNYQEQFLAYIRGTVAGQYMKNRSRPIYEEQKQANI